MNDDRELRGWSLVEPPVVRGPQSPRTLTLEVLSRPLVRESLELGIAREHDVPAHEAALVAARHAVRAVAAAVLAPYVVDGVALDVEPDQLGVDLDLVLVPRWTWLGRVEGRDGVVPEELGDRLAMLLDPVLDGARAVAGSGAVALVDGVLRSEAERLRAAGAVASAADVERLLAAVSAALSDEGWAQVELTVAVPASA